MYITVVTAPIIQINAYALYVDIVPTIRRRIMEISATINRFLFFGLIEIIPSERKYGIKSINACGIAYLFVVISPI